MEEQDREYESRGKGPGFSPALCAAVKSFWESRRHHYTENVPDYQKKIYRKQDLKEVGELMRKMNGK